MPASQRLAALPGLMTLFANAVDAANPLPLISIKEFASAPRLVAVRKISKKVTTFDLSVDQFPEFFASGILVHNCFRYFLDAAGFEFRESEPPKVKDQDMERRFYRPEDDLLDHSGNLIGID